MGQFPIVVVGQVATWQGASMSRSATKTAFIAGWALTVAMLSGCSRPAQPSTTKSSTTPAISSGVRSPSAPNGRLSWEDPPAWKRTAPINAMRIAQYTVARVAPDTEDAECVVTTFGPGQGGTAEQNLDRWIRQFAADDKTTLEKAARTVNGLMVTTLEMSGTYRGMGDGAARPGSRMLASVVETPNGSFFFKLTGPDATVREAKPGFEALLGSLTTATR